MVCMVAVQSHNWTALHLAASNGHVDAVKARLTAGTNLTATDVRGDVPCVGAGTGSIAVSVESSGTMISWSVVGNCWRG
jgi:hypothetical protein